MGQPERERGRPAKAASDISTAIKTEFSVADSGSGEQHAPLVALVLELRPALPYCIAESLVREALDACAGLVLDAEWARLREGHPAFVAATRNAMPYAERRIRQLADAEPREGDYLGGPVTRAVA